MTAKIGDCPGQSADKGAVAILDALHQLDKDRNTATGDKHVAQLDSITGNVRNGPDCLKKLESKMG